MTTTKEVETRKPIPKPPPDRGPVGVVTINVYVDHHISRIEGSLAALGDVTLDLHQIDRLERALTKGHVRNLLAVDKIEEEMNDSLSASS